MYESKRVCVHSTERQREREGKREREREREGERIKKSCLQTVSCLRHYAVAGNCSEGLRWKEGGLKEDACY